MTQSDDDDYAFFGTPLEQFEEDAVPIKKPITIQDQIATDKHGRRRFHGAFTGGFSAGFYNSVGSLEGWTPSSFKSSREKKADSKCQKPEDFMDDEDLEEFGIAPTVVRAKPEYSGNKTSQKRERIQFSNGPIPGEPVLNSILQPVRETVGVLLLMKMGWKPGQGIGPRLTKLQKKREKEKKIKVYGCSLPGLASDSDDSEGADDNIADHSLLFAPEEYEIHFLHPKINTLGMGYSGLDKNSLYPINSTLKSETFRMFDNNKKLAIKGQGFGVGAFEEDDEDIYAKEDMSQYDFALDSLVSNREKKRKEREATRWMSITDTHNALEGFVPAQKLILAKKSFPPPVIPSNYVAAHPKRRTRFDPQSSGTVDNKGLEKKHFITAEDRAAILDGTRPKNIAQDLSREEENADVKGGTETHLESFRPFIADPEKQQRYEKYLHFLKIGAKDAFPSVQPKSMSDWEKERERSEFEQAARLYKPLSGMMAEKFAHGELPDDSTDLLSSVPKSVSEDVDLVEAAKSKMYGKLTRRATDWSPCSLLCKRMNIAEPLNGSGISLSQIANNKKVNRSKFSVFNFLDVNKKNSFEENESVKAETTLTDYKACEDEEQVVKKEVEEAQNNLELPKTVINFEDPCEKKDLFKAIFCSDEESDNENGEKETLDEPVSTGTTSDMIAKPLTVANALRNTSPPRGIFANLDLDVLNKRKTPLTSDTSVPPESSTLSSENMAKDNVDESFVYGPSLPSKPVFSTRQIEVMKVSSSDSSSEGEWVEKKDEKEKKKHKKYKKSRLRKKHKSKNKKKRS